MVHVIATAIPPPPAFVHAFRQTQNVLVKRILALPISALGPPDPHCCVFRRGPCLTLHLTDREEYGVLLNLELSILPLQVLIRNYELGTLFYQILIKAPL